MQVLSVVLPLIVMLVWALAALYRVYRQARFYQIEEYMPRRYLRWWLRVRSRVLPTRTIAVFAALALFAAFSDSLPGGFSPVPHVAMLIAGLTALVPVPEADVKKKFIRTGRATRLLATAFAIVGLLAILSALLTLSRFSSSLSAALVIGVGGLALYLLAPLWLVLANTLLMPVEATLRRRFIARARHVLADVHPRVIGITGSFGKTTTKNFLHDILNSHARTYATPKSYNTMMGVCIALNNDVAQDYSIEYFICEMGAYIRGEIERICDLTPPDIAMVVEVGPQHLERFGSLENIATAKYEIIRALPPNGLGVFNWDNSYVRAMYERGYPAQRIAVSTQADPSRVTAAGPRLIASDIHETLAGLTFTVTDTLTSQREAFHTAVIGQHNVLNILLATAVALHEGMTLREVGQQVARLQPAESRLVRQTDERGVIVINDAYSANPVGIQSALAVLKMHPGRRLLITPGMVELGELHTTENRRLGVLAAAAATDIILIGAQQTQPIREGLQSTDFPLEHLHTLDHVQAAIQWYQTQLQAGDAVLLLNDLPDTY